MKNTSCSGNRRYFLYAARIFGSGFVVPFKKKPPAMIREVFVVV